MEAEAATPTAFMSYSHDSVEHGRWVLQLSARLVCDGIDVVLDQWDAELGSNLTHFMERGLRDQQFVVAVCTPDYVAKADGRRGGVGYEAQILSSQLFDGLADSARIIPAVRSHGGTGPATPTFLAGHIYVDLQEGPGYEASYEQLLRRLHNTPAEAKPPLGGNPFRPRDGGLYVPPSMLPSRYVSPAISGEVVFPYENNSGRYVIGAGDLAFTTSWSTAGRGSIYATTDGGVFSVALAPNVREFADIGDASSYDGSSRVRHARVGEAVVMRNHSDYWATLLIDSVTIRDTDPSGTGHLRFRYRIQTSRSADFAQEGGAA